LDRGRADPEALGELLARHPLAAAGGVETPVYAVDGSVWSRCDAESSPGRGFYYHPPRATRRGSPSWPAGPTSGSPDSASPAKAGSLRWT
jgi:hypothetical protein